MLINLAWGGGGGRVASGPTGGKKEWVDLRHLFFPRGSRGIMKEVNPYNVHYQRKAGYEAEKST